MDQNAHLEKIIVRQGIAITELMMQIDKLTERLNELQDYKDSKEIPF